MIESWLLRYVQLTKSAQLQNIIFPLEQVFRSNNNVIVILLISSLNYYWLVIAVLLMSLFLLLKFWAYKCPKNIQFTKNKKYNFTFFYELHSYCTLHRMTDKKIESQFFILTFQITIYFIAVINGFNFIDMAFNQISKIYRYCWKRNFKIKCMISDQVTCH